MVKAKKLRELNDSFYLSLRGAILGDVAIPYLMRLLHRLLTARNDNVVAGCSVEFFNSRKLKSFGIIEAVIASGIVVVVLSGALALSSSSLRSSSLGGSYLEAEHIADGLMEKITVAKAAKKLSFIAHGNYIFSIDCFDTIGRTAPGCKLPNGEYRPEVPYYGLDATSFTGNFVKVKHAETSDVFPDDFFKWQIKVINNRSCPSVGSVTIPKEKCRFVEINVKWQESSGVKDYYLTEYFADWES